MPIQIRRARPADANQLVAVIQTAFNEPADTAQIATCIAVGDLITFVALVDRRVVGFVDGFVTPALDGFQRVGQFQWWHLDQRSL